MEGKSHKILGLEEGTLGQNDNFLSESNKSESSKEGRNGYFKLLGETEEGEQNIDFDLKSG